MKRIKLLFILALMPVLFGCSSKNEIGPYYQSKNFTQDKTQYARAYVYFPNHGLAKGAKGPAIFFNDKKIVDLYNAGYTEVYVKPGVYDIHTSNVFTVLSNQFDNKKLTAKLDAGQTYYFALHSTINNNADIFYGSNGLTTPTVPTNLNSSELISLAEIKAKPGLSLCHYEEPILTIVS